MRRAPRVAKMCDRCGQPVPARFRTVFDRFLCDFCYEELVYGFGV